MLSTDQLAQALAEQQKSGGLLGEVIVAQGLASRHEVARALAEQSGLVLDQELEFGSGLLDEIRRRHEGQPREAPDGKPGLASVPESLARGYELLRIEPDPREGPAADRERDLELERLRAELSLVRKELGEHTHRLTKALASRDQHDLERDRLRRAVEEREDALTRATAESAELKRRLEATEQEVSALERALQEREHERAEPHAGNQPRQALDSHLVFVPQGGSYELLERPVLHQTSARAWQRARTGTDTSWSPRLPAHRSRSTRVRARTSALRIRHSPNVTRQRALRRSAVGGTWHCANTSSSQRNRSDRRMPQPRPSTWQFTHQLRQTNVTSSTSCGRRSSLAPGRKAHGVTRGSRSPLPPVGLRSPFGDQIPRGSD